MADVPNDQTGVQFQIGDFLLLPVQKKLQRGSAEWNLSPQRLSILTLLASMAPEHVSVALLRQRVWNGQTRAQNTIHQAILDLRRFLDDDQTLIKTDEEGCYYLGLPVSQRFKASEDGAEHTSERSAESTEGEAALSSSRGRFALASFSKGCLVGAVLAAAALIPFIPAARALLGPRPSKAPIYSPSDEEAIQHVVRESQLFITLQVYRNPNGVDSTKLHEYLVPESAGGKEAATVRKIIDRFKSQNLRYGDESKNEGFEVTSVTVFSPGDTAEATTLEGWYVPTYKDGQRDQSRKAILGPYRLFYQLRKLDNKWRIESSTTPIRKE